VNRILWELIMKAKGEEEVTLEVLQEVVMMLLELVLSGQESGLDTNTYAFTIGE